MTEQEAEEWARRLEGIWTSEHATTYRKLTLVDEATGYKWQWLAELGEGVEVYIGNQYQGGMEIQLTCLPKGEFCQYGHLHYEHNTIQPWRKYIISRRNEADYDRFSEAWLSFFRRNCWLSGCTVEATAHEKAEWIQGFSREELQAWNLQF